MSTPEQLFARFRATGEAAPLGELFDVASGELLALALHLCGNPADAEDALQATFLTAIAQRGQWDSARRVLPWLCGILTMHAKKIAERRARRRETALPEPDLVLDDGSPVAASERRELIGRLRQHVDRLPAEQRQVLLLQLEHGLAPAEVAEVLGVPPGTVRMRLHRGVAALRGLMPAGLFALLLGTLPTRGVAAVRAAVLQHAAGAVAGALLLKKVVAAIAVLVVLAVGWYAAAPLSRTNERTDGAAPVLVTGGPVANSHERARDGAAESTTERVDVTAPVVEPAAAVAAGTLVVRTIDRVARTPVPHLPIEVIAVRSDADSQFDAWHAATDRAGRGEIAGLPPGTYNVGVGEATGTGVVTAGASTTVDVQLQPRVSLICGCVKLANGAPAAGATLVAALQYTHAAGPIGTAGANGRFELPMACGLVMLGARLEGHAPSPLQLVSGRPGEDLVLVLPSLGASVRGLVVDETGAPVSGAVVDIGETRQRRWFDADRVFAAPPAQRLHVATDGSFHAGDLPAEQVSVFVRADGFAPFHRYVTPHAGETIDVRCELSAGVAIRGRVIDQHAQPVADVRVRLGGTSGEQRVADADGRFAFRHAELGLQQLEVAGDAIDKRFCERNVVDAAEWIVQVTKLTAFPLRLVDDQGVPLEAWTVRVVSSCDREAVTDACGRAVLHTRGDGPASLWLAPEEGIDAVMPWQWPANAMPGVETTIVVPAAKQPCAVLTGVVRTAGGAPARDLRLFLRAPDGKYVAGATFVGDAFRVEHLPAGDWELVIGTDVGPRVAVRALRHGEVRDLGTLTLPPMGAVLARVVLPDGAPAPDPGLFLFDAEGRDVPVPANGEPHELPAGRYTWRVIANDALWQRGDIVVRAGATTPLDVTLRPGVRRYVRFPVPRPDWGEPALVKYVLRAADGGEYDRGDFDPRDDMPHRYMPALAVGQWRVELELDDGRRFHGAFTLDTLTPSRAPIDVTVQPTR